MKNLRLPAMLCAGIALAACLDLALRPAPDVAEGRTTRFAGTVLGDVRAGENGASSYAFGLDGGPAGVEAGGGAAEPCCEWPGRFVVGLDDRT